MSAGVGQEGVVLLGLVVALLCWLAASPWRVAGRRPSVTGRTVLGRGDPGRRGAVRPWPGRPQAAVGRTTETRVDLAVVLDLLGAALGAGTGIPRALEATGRALGGADGAGLRAVGASLLLGAGWDTAWAAAPRRFSVLAEALRPAWTHGAAPREALRVAGAQVAQEAAARARTEAARLGVRLVLPLGLCFLPAFVLIGLVPVLVSLGSGVLAS